MLYSCFILYCILCQQISITICAKALTESHLLHQAKQSERGQEGGSGEETESPAPGVTVDGSLQRFPEGRRACQTVHEGGKKMFYGKGGNWV